MNLESQRGRTPMRMRLRLLLAASAKLHRFLG
jgi:hypothetical protein